MHAPKTLVCRTRSLVSKPQRPPPPMRWPPAVPSISDLFGARFPQLWTHNPPEETQQNQQPPAEHGPQLLQEPDPSAVLPAPPHGPPDHADESSASQQPAPTNKQRSGRQVPRSHNWVLPSYEEELQADNSVVREGAPRWLARTALHALHSLVARIWSVQPAITDGTSQEAARIHPSRALASAVNRLTRTPSDIKRVAVLGVHGWFPGRLLQRVVGEPIGTSSHFARKMALACQHFFHERYGISLHPENMTIIPLDAEGKVEDRVRLLFAQISDPSRGWADVVRSADLVLVAAHSQGTPVATMLVARMIDEGILDPRRQRTGLLAMAGISHGPYPQLKSSVIVQYVESDPARQLFEFNDPNSSISITYYTAIHKILSAGVRFIAVGSWYDQVVPLYSATLHGINHPLLYRALYIDAVDYNPDFLSHLVVFALKLRNSGLSDHGLIVHLSDVLAGNLYGFGTQGHYAIYEEENTYTVAVAWTMGSKTSWMMRSHQQSEKQENRRRSSFESADANLHQQTLVDTSHSAQPSNATPSQSSGSDDPSKQASSPSPAANNAPDSTQKQKHENVHSDQQPQNQPFRSILMDPPFRAPSRLNPYHLPWIMARLTSDPEIARDSRLSQDLTKIIRLFESWEVGSSRALKDIKYRLEPLKSRL